jgi:putative ABC transport system permease protein
VVTLVASVLPARRAARVAPVEALRDGAEQPRAGSLRRRLLAGTALTAVGLGVLLFGLFGGSGSAAELVGAGAALTFLGVAALSPIVARPAALVLGRPLRALGVPGRLGQENAMRNPRRTAATAAALMVGLALVSMVSILSASLKASFTAALEETLRADLTVTTSSFQPFSPEVAERIRALPEVAAVAEFRQGLFRLRGETLLLTAVDPATIERVAALDLREGSVASLAQGRVLVSADVARERGISVGDRLTLTFPGSGPEPFVVGGLHGEDRLVGDWVVSLATYERRYPEQLDTFVLLKGAEGVSPRALQAAVERAVADFPSLDVQDQAAFREKQAGFVDQLLNLVTVLLLLAVVIALVGIANTLGLSILERTREIGLLRAIGMTRRQLRSAVRWEAVIIAVFGALLGLVVGLGFGVALQRALAGEGLSELAIPAGRLAVSVVLAGLAGVVAAVGPARRAARLDVLRAIAYE